jgi:hypothetical protein
MKKTASQRFLPQFARKLGANQSELAELFGVSRFYLHKLSTGERRLTGRLLEQAAMMTMKESILKVSAAVPAAPPKDMCGRKKSITEKKINDILVELEYLQQTEEAIRYVDQLRSQFNVKDAEHEWFTLHLRRLKQRLPKQPDVQRAEWEAKLAGLHAEKKYWEKKAL